MEVLAADCLEVEEALEGVGGGDCGECGGGEEPEGEVDLGRDAEELGGGAGGEGQPEDGLAGEAEADAEATDREPEEERPRLVFWEEDVFVVLNGSLGLGHLIIKINIKCFIPSFLLKSHIIPSPSNA